MNGDNDTAFDAAVLRESVAAAIEELIAALDLLDGDPDLEDDDPGGGDVLNEPHDALDEDGAEPSLGATHSVSQLWWSRSGQQDLEDTNEDGGDINDACQLDESDLEPSLGAPENPGGDQAHWAQGDRSDDAEGTDGMEDDPAVLEAARKRQRENWGKAGEAGREAAKQLARMKGHPTPLGINSNVSLVIVGPDAARYLVSGL